MLEDVDPLLGVTYGVEENKFGQNTLILSVVHESWRYSPDSCEAYASI